MNFGSNKGISLIETIVIISVFSIVMAVLSFSVLYFYRTNTFGVKQVYAIESARKGVELMARDIREIIYSDDGSYPVIEIDPFYFYFYSDIDRDNNIERIKYYVDGSNLKKAITKPTGDPLVYEDINETVSVISDNVRNADQDVSVFTYYDDTGVEITDFSRGIDVAFVKIRLIVNIDPNRNPEEFTLRSSATLRNLKTNL